MPGWGLVSSYTVIFKELGGPTITDHKAALLTSLINVIYIAGRLGFGLLAQKLGNKNMHLLSLSVQVRNE